MSITLNELVDRARVTTTFSPDPRDRAGAQVFLAAVALLDAERPDWRERADILWPSSSDPDAFSACYETLRRSLLQKLSKGSSNERR